DTRLTFQFLDSQVAGFDKTQLRVLYSADGVKWIPLATDASLLARDELSATTSALGYFAIGLAAATGIPSATLVTAPPTTNPGGTTQQITVQFSDPISGINGASLGNGDVVVTYPDGVSASATLVSETPSGNVVSGGGGSATPPTGPLIASMSASGAQGNAN